MWTGVDPVSQQVPAIKEAQLKFDSPTGKFAIGTFSSMAKASDMVLRIRRFHDGRLHSHNGIANSFEIVQLVVQPEDSTFRIAIVVAWDHDCVNKLAADEHLYQRQRTQMEERLPPRQRGNYHVPKSSTFSSSSIVIVLVCVVILSCALFFMLRRRAVGKVTNSGVGGVSDMNDDVTASL